MKKSTELREKEKLSSRKVEAIGLDVSDTSGCYVAVAADGEIVDRGKVMMRRAAVIDWARRLEPTVIALEAGTHSPWLSRTLVECGHEVIVANPAKVALITRNERKRDPIDAEYLARFARFDRKMLHPIQHRGERAQRDLQVIRSREQLVRVRSRLISHVRGAVKSYGERIVKCSAEAFSAKAATQIPQELREALDPILETIGELTRRVRAYDRTIAALIESQYREARHLQQIKGVGPITSLAYVLVLEDARRYKSSRNVGAFLGLVPGSNQSGAADPQQPITRRGDRLLRTVLIQSAQYILGPLGEDCDLRRHGEAIAARGGAKAKKRAAVAVARKLAVLMHRLWITQAVYDPLYNARKRTGGAALRGQALQGAA